MGQVTSGLDSDFLLGLSISSFDSFNGKNDSVTNYWCQIRVGCIYDMRCSWVGSKMNENVTFKTMSMFSDLNHVPHMNYPFQV